MILLNGDPDLTIHIHGVRVPNLPHGVLVESRARAVVDQARVESLDGGQAIGMMITGLVMDGIRRVASQPIIVPKVASRLIQTYLEIPFQVEDISIKIRWWKWKEIQEVVIIEVGCGVCCRLPPVLKVVNITFIHICGLLCLV